jgi:hypothetical protein
MFVASLRHARPFAALERLVHALERHADPPTTGGLARVGPFVSSAELTIGGKDPPEDRDRLVAARRLVTTMAPVATLAEAVVQLGNGAQIVFVEAPIAFDTVRRLEAAYGARLYWQPTNTGA